MTYLDYLEHKVLLERLVIGLEEPVLIKGLGELQAKIDSGNSGFNVIHGTDFHQQGKVLMFTTIDSSGNEKKISANVIDEIEINMGGGNIETRPVIELDIKFANEDYKKIPFSVSDRSSNSNPILISKGFVENELEALIDVGKKNISQDGIDVVYGESYLLEEGVLGAIGKGIAGAAKGVGAVAKGAVKTAGDIKRGMQTVGNAYSKTLNAIGKFGDWMGGDAKMSDWMPSAQGIKDTTKQITKGIISATGLRSMWKLAARFKTGLSLNSEDPKKIKQKLKTSQDIPKLYTSLDATAGTIYQQEKPNFDNVQIIPLFNFSFQKGKIGSKNYVKGMETQAKKFKTAIAQSKEGVDSRKKDQADKDLHKQSEDQLNWSAPKSDVEKEKEAVNDAYNYFSDIFRDTLLIFEDTASPVVPQTTVPAAIPTATPTSNQSSDTQNGQNTEQQNAKNNETSDETEVQKADKQMSDDEIQNLSVKFDNLSEFFLWYCTLGEPNIKADKNKGYKKKMEELINKQFLSGKFDADFAKIYASTSPVTPETFKPLIEKIVAASSSIEFEEQEEAPESEDETVLSDDTQQSDTTEQQPTTDQEDKNKVRERKSKLTGVFCLAYSKSPDNPTAREYHFFVNQKQIIYNSDSENQKNDADEQTEKQKVEDAEKLEQDKQAFTQRIKEIIPFDKVNTQFNIDAVQLNAALNGKGDYTEAINAVIDNSDSFPKSFQYLDALTQRDTSMTDKDKENALAKLSQTLNQEYPLFVISQIPQGQGALKALNDYKWVSEQDFIDKCFENEQAKTAILLDDKAPNFAEMEKQALANSGQPTDGQITDGQDSEVSDTQPTDGQITEPSNNQSSQIIEPQPNQQNQNIPIEPQSTVNHQPQEEPTTNTQEKTTEDTDDDEDLDTQRDSSSSEVESEEEEPWDDEKENDPWIKSKLKYFKNKGIL